jgi:hypothetical protein
MNYLIKIYSLVFIRGYIGWLRLIYFIDSLDAHPLQKIVDKNNKEKIRKLENKFVYCKKK